MTNPVKHGMRIAASKIKNHPQLGFLCILAVLSQMCALPHHSQTGRSTLGHGSQTVVHLTVVNMGGSFSGG